MTVSVPQLLLQQQQAPVSQDDNAPSRRMKALEISTCLGGGDELQDGSESSTFSHHPPYPHKMKQSPLSSTQQALLSQQQPLLVPSIGKLSSFLATTCCLWLSEPLLSLVDTTFVSWSLQVDEDDEESSSHQLVTQLAAMGLATTFMDTLVYMTYFLAIATTTQIAEQVAHKHYRQLQISTSRLLGFAILCGCLVTFLTWTTAHMWLHHLAGGADYEITAPELLPLATSFVQIRATVAPLTVSGMVAHSFCLVTDHTWTVAIAVLVSAITNVLLDIILTPQYGMLGAATATACATSFSALIMLRCVYQQMQLWRVQEVVESTEGHGADDFDDNEQRHHDDEVLCMVQLSPNSSTSSHNDPMHDPSGSSAPSSATSSTCSNSSRQHANKKYDVESDDDETEHDNDQHGTDPPEHAQLLLPPRMPKQQPHQQQRSHSFTHNTNVINHHTSSSQPPSNAESNTKHHKCNNYTYNKQPVPIVSLPDKEALIQLLKLSLPLAFYMWAETASYASLTICATEFGPVALAAQNVLMQVFHVLCCISESLAQAAQAFLPATLYPRYHEPSFVQVLMRLCRVAAVVAIVGYQLSLMILGGTNNNNATGTTSTMWGWLVGGGHGAASAAATPSISEGGQHLLEDALDPLVIQQLQLASPYLAACLCLHPFNAVIEGTVIATRDFANIVRTYIVTLIVFGMVLKFATNDLAQVWRALVVWQLLRMFNYGWWRRRSTTTIASTGGSSSSKNNSNTSTCTNDTINRNNHGKGSAGILSRKPDPIGYLPA